MRKILIQDTLRVLEQGIRLLEVLDDDLYGKPEPAVSMSAIGSHLRHCIDYFERFLIGALEGRIDYDRRERDTLVESSRVRARERLRAIHVGCRGLLERDGDELVVKQDSAEPDAQAPWARTSLERELQFQCSHTVHHFALIGVILRLNGIEPEEGFGVAPSTLRHWKESGVVHGDLDPRGA